MPYTVDNPPDALEGLPKHLIEIWVAAYNSAFKQYNGNEGKAAGTAWAAVKTKYKKNEQGKWVAKEARMLSDKNKSTLLQAALMSEYKIGQSVPIPKNLTIDEVFTDKVIYDVDGQLYESIYELDEDGKVTFSDPKKVLSTKVYKAMESLQSTYSEIIQEAGKRNASLDSVRIKKIVELCQELLSSEDVPEDKTKEALKEAVSVLKIIKEQAAMKTEDGVKFPAAAFAYVPDPEKPSEWKLRLWEDPTKKVTRRQLGAAAAALSPGGFRGQKVQIPSADLPAVKRKIRAEYRKLDVADEDIPRWVKESTEKRIRIRETTTNVLAEEVTAKEIYEGILPLRIIRPGFNESKERYYSNQSIKDASRIFENTKMYADHPTPSEEKERPERSIRDWVSTLHDTRVSESQNAVGKAHIHSGWLKEMVQNLFEQGNLNQLGTSINAVGTATKQTIDGIETLYIESLTGGKSVDFVTEAGAGGQAGLKESISDEILDTELIDLAMLKDARPDLVKLLEGEVRENLKQEVKKAMENEERVKELEGQIETLTTERDTLKEAAEQAVKEKAKAEAQASIKEAVDKAELPDAAKERLVERFKDSESAEGIEEAVKSEIDYIAKLSEAGKVKGLGGSKPDTEKDHEALKESFKRLNPDWSDEQLKLAVSGR